eukprot:TRINITY_DN56088_c0_g1_i1.p1 TRINITY_DN56088_c0_g1~~TRINITY_DN56088_c0_g1_i1.p1  ORF type:complete len:567 (+),score=168.38 TRINITY_DN56088_c0_g1_i1:82-1782(+)
MPPNTGSTLVAGYSSKPKHVRPEKQAAPTQPAAAASAEVGNPSRNGAGIGTCGHNDWDHVRSAAGKAHLRCRDCQSRAVVPLAADAYRQRCAPFRSPEGCPQGPQCPNLHVRKDKQRLEERQAVHGPSVLQGVRKDQLEAHHRAMTLRYSENTGAAAAAQSRAQFVSDGDPPPLLDELTAVDTVAGSELPQREVASRVKEAEEIIKDRRKHGGCPKGGVVTRCIQKLNDFPQLRAPGQRQAPVSTQVERDLAGVWCSKGRYFHPEEPPPYPKCDCGQAEDEVPRCWTFRPMLGSRMPCLFVSMPFGPMPLVTPMPDMQPLTELLKAYPGRFTYRPRAVLVIAAHWCTQVPTVSIAPNPSTVHDFPPSMAPEEAFGLQYNAPGAPQVAARAAALLQHAGLPCNACPKAGRTHGAWVPLTLLYPDQSVPVIQLSLSPSMDAAQHIALGRALSPLRDEGVLIIGSGATFHYPRDFPDGPREEISVHCLKFDNWLRETLCTPRLSDEQRTASLANWQSAPSALQCHPQGSPEHFLPLLVLFGAAAAGSCAHLCDLGCVITHLVWSCYEWL